MRLGLIDDFVQIGEVEFDLRLIDINPAALAPQVATVENGNVDEGRKIDALLHPFFVKIDRVNPFDPEVPHELRQMALVSGPQDPSRVLEARNYHEGKLADISNFQIFSLSNFHTRHFRAEATVASSCTTAWSAAAILAG